MIAQFGSPQGKGVKSSYFNCPWLCDTAASNTSAAFSELGRAATASPTMGVKGRRPLWNMG